MKHGELCRICEKADADAWEDTLAAAPETFRAKVSVYRKRIGSAVLGAISDLDVVAMNRAVGLGYPNAPLDSDLDAIMEFYDRAGSRRYAVQLCPTAASPQLVEKLQERGFTHFNNWTKLIYQNNAEVPRSESNLRVEKIDGSQGKDFASIVCPSFSWPGVARDFVSALIGRPGWHHFMGFDGHDAVGTGALFVKDGIAWMGFAATHPEHRRKGAQSLLIAKRLEAAKELGCEHVVAETAQELPGNPNTSYHNLIRHGFTVAYQRPNYLRFREDEPHEEE